MKNMSHSLPQTSSGISISRMTQYIPVSFLGILVIASTCLAQITVTGIADKKIYADRVSFTVLSEAGYDYTSELNGISVITDTSITINEPQYYELLVSRRQQSTGTVENVVIRFIVRATERANTEWGLPLFTPYPMINSAAAEYVGSQLIIVTPATYPAGLEIPVIARVENASGKRTGVNGNVQAVGFENHPLQLLRGVGSVFLPAAIEPGFISYAAQVQSLSSPKQINIETTSSWQTISGTIAASTDWGQNARIRITGNLTIGSGVTLTIGAGSVIVISPNVGITVTGHIVVDGTNEQPVVFTAQDRTAPWGGFILESATSQGDFTGCIFTASGADANWFSNHSGYFSHRSEQCLFLLSNNAHVTLTDCFIVENKGQIGHGEHGYLTMTGCLMKKAVTVGQYNNGSVSMNDCAMVEFPPVRTAFVDADNDSIYLSGGPHSFTDCLFGWTLDAAIDAGQGDEGAVTVAGCWFESCIHEAMAWSSGPRYATVTDTVVINCGQAIECGYDYPFIDADNCLCTGNLVGARFGDNYARTFSGFLDVQNSLLLFNWRDVWGRAWDNWQLHLAQMDIQNNYVSVLDDNYPNNRLWDPQNEPNQLNDLEFFLPSPAESVGIGIAANRNIFDLSELQPENDIPVRLSTFSTQYISVNYAVNTNAGLLKSGTLNFIPGQTVEHIEFTFPSTDNLRQVRITLSDPVNAELTGYSSALYQKPYVLNKTLITEGDQWQYFKGTNEPDTNWNLTTFTPGDSWLTGPSGFGYETGTGYGSCIATNLTDMKGNYYSVYARKLFWIEDPLRVMSLILGMRWDDGFIAYVNGHPVENQYGPLNPAHDQPASTSDHEACCSCTPDRFDLSSFTDILVPGYNVLALQVHNTSLSSSDFLFIPELFGSVSPVPGDIEPDGDVDLNDFAVFALSWLSEDGQSHYDPLCDIDSTVDGLIDLLDLAIFVQNWLSD